MNMSELLIRGLNVCCNSRVVTMKSLLRAVNEMDTVGKNSGYDDNGDMTIERKSCHR
jgi:hypothetical protein